MKEFSDREGIQALYFNVQVKKENGWAVFEPGAGNCRVEIADGDLGTGVDTITVNSGSVLLGGDVVTIPEQTLSITEGSNEPRKDVIIVNPQGDITRISGYPEPRHPSSAPLPRSERPAPSSLANADGVPLAILAIGPDATEITQDEIVDIRRRAEMDVSHLNADTATVRSEPEADTDVVRNADIASYISGINLQDDSTEVTDITDIIAGDNLLLDDGHGTGTVRIDSQGGEMGSVSHNDLMDIQPGQHHSPYTDSQAQTAVDGANVDIQGTADSTQSAVDTVQTTLSDHTSDTDNPHEVTAGDVGALTPADKDDFALYQYTEQFDDSSSSHRVLLRLEDDNGFYATVYGGGSLGLQAARKVSLSFYKSDDTYNASHTTVGDQFTDRVRLYITEAVEDGNTVHYLCAYGQYQHRAVLHITGGYAELDYIGNEVSEENVPGTEIYSTDDPATSEYWTGPINANGTIDATEDVTVSGNSVATQNWANNNFAEGGSGLYEVVASASDTDETSGLDLDISIPDPEAYATYEIRGMLTGQAASGDGANVGMDITLNNNTDAIYDYSQKEEGTTNYESGETAWTEQLWRRYKTPINYTINADSVPSTDESEGTDTAFVTINSNGHQARRGLESGRIGGGYANGGHPFATIESIQLSASNAFTADVVVYGLDWRSDL